MAAGATSANLELVHFGCTSEDINNLSYAKLLHAARIVLLGAADELMRRAHDPGAAPTPTLPMLARTHGQPASPTTLGKEFANVVARLRRAHRRLAQVAILGKWNGAVGNFNAQVAALPELPWPQIAQRFVESLGLTTIRFTTQIEPHDWIGEYCDALAAINVISIDLCRDIWGYVSLGYLRQKPVAGEVGSSTMPHKINPIDFENAEGNLGRRQCTAAALRREAAGVALAARSHRLHGAAQCRRGARSHPGRLALRAARPREDRRRSGAHRRRRQWRLGGARRGGADGAARPGCGRRLRTVEGIHPRACHRWRTAFAPSSNRCPYRRRRRLGCSS